jgi:hypothetical protein
MWVPPPIGCLEPAHRIDRGAAMTMCVGVWQGITAVIERV